MAKTVKKESAAKTDANDLPKRSWKISRQQKMLFGSLLVLFAIALLVAFISYFMYGTQDQSAVSALSDRNEKAGNWLGKFGALLADFFIHRGFGAASFLFVKEL